MKICTVCKEEKEVSEFTLKKGKPNAACKKCTRARAKAHYDKNKQYYKDKRDKHRRKTFDWIKDAKEKGQCIQCGENEPCCLDYHHIHSKEENISQIVNRKGWGIERIKKEMDKCLIVCANCHRKHHAGIIDLHVYIK